MKKLILLSTFFFSITVNALPDCPSNTSVRWDNCSGTFTYDNGAVYVGEWQMDTRHGQGTITFANGNTYTGNFKDGSYNGKGTFSYNNGDKYVGNFKNNFFDGQGTFTWASEGWKGDKYIGNFKNDLRHGKGTYFFADGDKQIGYFMEGDYIPDICQEMGFSKATEQYGDCILQLIDDL